MLDPTPLEAYFSRLGAIDELARELAEHWGSVEAFLRADFETKLLAVVGRQQARTITMHYDDFEHLRDRGSYGALIGLDGVGSTSAGQVSDAYIRGTILTPRDVLSAVALAQKMGLVREPPQQPSEHQAGLRRWSA